MEINFNFPKESEFEFWYLYWISNPYQKRINLVSTIYFVNARTDSDKTKLTNNSSNFGDLYQCIIPYQEIISLTLGSIYDKNNKLIKNPEQFKRVPFKVKIKANKKLENIQFLKTSELTSDYITKSKNPIINNSDFWESKFLTTKKSFNSKDEKTVIIPAHVLFNFYYGFSTNVVQLLTRNLISQAIKKEDVFLDEINNVLNVIYDNRYLNESEIKFLSNHLIFKDLKGLDCMRYIGANILNQLLNDSNKAILDILLPNHEDFSLDVYSKSLGENIILIYEIIGINQKEKEKQIQFSNIKNIKKFPDTTKSKDNPGTTIDITVPVINNDGFISDNTESGTDKGNDQNITRTGTIKKHFFEIDIPKIVVRKKEDISNSNGVKLIKSDSDHDHLNTNNGGEHIDDMGLYLNYCLRFEIYDRVLYVKSVLEELQKNNVLVDYIKLSNKDYSTIGFVYNHNNTPRNVIIAHLFHNNKHSYLLEFQSGITELISNKNRFQELSHLELDNFIFRYFEFKKLLKSKDIFNLKLQFPTGKLYHQESNNLERKIQNSDIIMFPGIEHQSKNMEDFAYLINHTTNKIIKKIK